MTLGERLLEYRTNAKMSQDTLAEKVGVTRQTVSKWETDQSAPEFSKILPLCEIFEITTDELIKGKEEQEKKEKVSSTKQDDFIAYNEKRNKKKAIFISISVFLYIIGTFSVPYTTETLNYDDGKGVMIMAMLWRNCNCYAYLLFHFIS